MEAMMNKAKFQEKCRVWCGTGIPGSGICKFLILEFAKKEPATVEERDTPDNGSTNADKKLSVNMDRVCFSCAPVEILLQVSFSQQQFQYLITQSQKEKEAY